MMLARTVREAELEMQLSQARREIAELRWAVGPYGDFGRCPAKEPEPMSLQHPLPATLRVIASVDLLRHAEAVPSGQIVIHGTAEGKEGSMGFRTYLSEGELLSTRDAAEYLSYLHDRACREIAKHFSERSSDPTRGRERE